MHCCLSFLPLSMNKEVSIVFLYDQYRSSKLTPHVGFKPSTPPQASLHPQKRTSSYDSKFKTNEVQPLHNLHLPTCKLACLFFSWIFILSHIYSSCLIAQFRSMWSGPFSQYNIILIWYYNIYKKSEFETFCCCHSNGVFHLKILYLQLIPYAIFGILASWHFLFFLVFPLCINQIWCQSSLAMPKLCFQHHRTIAPTRLNSP